MREQNGERISQCPLEGLQLQFTLKIRVKTAGIEVGRKDTDIERWQRRFKQEKLRRYSKGKVGRCFIDEWQLIGR
jgi:hypothetical protein